MLKHIRHPLHTKFQYRRKAGLILIVLMLLTMLSSCFAGGRFNFLKDEDYLTKSREEQLFSAIRSNDANTIAESFSNKAISEAENLSDNIAALLDLLSNVDFEYSDVTASIGRTYDYGNFRLEISAWYDITIENKEYTFHFIDFPTDTITPENFGLYAIYFISNDVDDERLRNMNTPGVNIIT